MARSIWVGDEIKFLGHLDLFTLMSSTLERTNYSAWIYGCRKQHGYDTLKISVLTRKVNTINYPLPKFWIWILFLLNNKLRGWSIFMSLEEILSTIQSKFRFIFVPWTSWKNQFLKDKLNFLIIRKKKVLVEGGII